MNATFGRRETGKTKLILQVLGSSIAAGAILPLLWRLIYVLGNEMDELTAMEKAVHMERFSLQSAHLVMLEMATSSLVMLSFGVAFLLAPAFWGWWAAKLKGEDISTAWRAVLLTIAMVVPTGIAAGLMCIAFRGAPWSALACRFAEDRFSGGIFALMFLISLIFWERYPAGKKAK